MALCFAHVFNYWHFDPAIRSTLTIGLQTFRGYGSNIIWKFKKRLEKFPLLVSRPQMKFRAFNHLVEDHKFFDPSYTFYVALLNSIKS